MGKDSELFKAAQTGNNALLERVFSSHLRKHGGQGGGGSHGFGSVRMKSHPNIQDDAGYTLLHHATIQSQGQTVSLLLRCGASTTISDNSGSCPLHLAAWKGDLEIVKMLVTQGPSRANVNQQSDSEDSALHLASQYGYSDVVEFLLERHADPLLVNVKGETALDLAAQYGHIDTVHLLISHCPRVLYLQRPQFSPLHLAARNGHTVVSLSLINAGISVNTVCEGGTALHGAAMCGKAETVQLLLDKGANLELQDSKGRTVFDVLDEFSAEKALSIKKMINDHVTSAPKSSSPQHSSAKNQHILAITQTNCLPVVEESNALAFKKGDTIVVQEKRGDGLYIGTCHGRTGSFLAEDVVFFSKREGELVATDVSTLSSGTYLWAENTSCDGVKKLTVSTKAPYEDIPGFPTTLPSETVPAVATDATPSITVDETTNGQSEVIPSVASISSTSDSNQTSLALKSRTENKRLSKKDKIFQLSKDTGAYAELSPINPVEAKKEFGDTLKLNPVGPAFGGVNESQVVTTHNVAPAEDRDSSSFMGSYYVLEVGNFDQNTQVQVTLPRDDPNSANQESTSCDEQSVQPGGYYMLDVHNFDSSEVAKNNTQDGNHYNILSRHGQYENTQKPKNKSRSYHSPGNASMPSNGSSLTGMPRPSLTSPSGTLASNTGPEKVQSPPGQNDNPSYCNVSRGSVPPSYENVVVLSGEASQIPPPLPQKKRHRGLSESGPGKLVDEEKTSSLRRRNIVYEAVDVGHHTRAMPTVDKPEHSPNSDPEGLSTDPKRLNPDSEGLNVVSDSEIMTLKKISTSSDPFAGLVLSASTQMEESLELTNGAHRERMDTIWDNDRVEKEWTQIDTLLKDMTFQSPDQALRNNSETLSSWLSKHGLSGCVSALESHGFDNLSFLGANILTMDDLEDIGISSPDDQYNLMAAVSLLPAPPQVGQAKNVSEWLKLLQLSLLESKFEQYPLEKLTFIWEVELTMVVGIELLGYRKRLQYGMSELRSAHPEWIDKSSPNRSPSSLPPAKTQLDNVSFSKDYRKINSLSKTRLLDNSNLEVRSPTDAQTIQVGKGHHTTKLPSATWKHPHTALINDSICYPAKYLGSVIINKLHGNQSAEEACLKLRSTTESMEEKPEIILSISWKGVKFVDAHSKVIVSRHAIRDISCCSPDIEDKRVFAYITKDRPSGKYYSHVFITATQESASEIMMTIAQIFEICYQKVMKARSKAAGSCISKPSSSQNKHNISTTLT